MSTNPRPGRVLRSAGLAALIVLVALCKCAQGADTGAGKSSIENLTVVQAGARFVELVWKSEGKEFEIESSTSETNNWVRSPRTDVCAGSVVNLRPETNYEFRVRATSPEGPYSQVITARTTAEAPFIGLGFSLTPPKRPEMGEMSKVSQPCLVWHDDLPWVVYTFDRLIQLAKLSTDLDVVLGTKQLGDQKSSYVRNLEACVHDNKLYVMYTLVPRASSGLPAEVHVFHYDFDSERCSDPIPIPPTGWKRICEAGGIAVWNNKVWLGVLENWQEYGNSYCRLVLRSLTDEGPGQAVVMPVVGNAYPSTSALSVIGASLAVTWTDLRPRWSGTQCSEPLYLTLFNGSEFAPPLLLTSNGRNWASRAWELGSSVFTLFSSNDRYCPDSGTRFQELRIASVDQITSKVAVCSFLADRKYNTFPHICRVDDTHLLAMWAKYSTPPGKDKLLEPHGIYLSMIGAASSAK